MKKTTIKRIKSKAVLRKGHVTAAEEAFGTSRKMEVKVSLDEQSMKRIDVMAFKQVQTHSRMDKLESSMQTLANLVTGMAEQVNKQLARIKSPPAISSPLFYPRMFNKVSMKLRKKSIDVQVEDIYEGVKRRRVFRCTDWTRVEHLMSYRTLTEGIEELEPRVPTRRTARKVVAKKPVRRAKTAEEVRYEMERDGERNQVVPSKDDGRRTFYNPELAKACEATNRSRTNAEKVIVKICSPGGQAEGAKNQPLIEALHANGFDKSVAFYAAMNCGRITDPKLIAEFNKQFKKPAPEAHSNPY